MTSRSMDDWWACVSRVEESKPKVLGSVGLPKLAGLEDHGSLACLGALVPCPGPWYLC